ncbi:tRNA pseudouridine synthase A [Neolewinella aurantiaca]|uniref:tRNA pseudouridine synthase A n=1 Tax=Neolewinella aurantiaca TaxID=2602767 RepID=A0A5C7FI98_9BACT|nr:tRNA pseudouridine synthase A [Neolewinella aurantiaca]TXF89501.1 tRNA pseudouridine synthase A [Neolewinella aurantiaca]
MHHYFLSLAYDGTDYRGWQRQPGGVITVQQTLEEVLSKVHRREVILGGCGRTDAGVHATQFYAYLRTDQPLPEHYTFIVNKRLPAGISLYAALPVPDNAQARFDATERTYDYFLHSKPDAWLDRASGLFDLSEFDPGRVVRALPLLLEHEDFRAFCKAPDRHNTTIVHFREATIFRNAAGDRFRLRFVANRFLRGMIRLLVDNLMRIGKGEISVEDFARALRTGERLERFHLAPPEGLYLTGVRYPYVNAGPVLPVCGREAWVEILPETEGI